MKKVMMEYRHCVNRTKRQRASAFAGSVCGVRWDRKDTASGAVWGKQGAFSLVNLQRFVPVTNAERLSNLWFDMQAGWNRGYFMTHP